MNGQGRYQTKNTKSNGRNTSKTTKSCMSCMRDTFTTTPRNQLSKQMKNVHLAFVQILNKFSNLEKKRKKKKKERRKKKKRGLNSKLFKIMDVQAARNQCVLRCIPLGEGGEKWQSVFSAFRS